MQNLTRVTFAKYGGQLEITPLTLPELKPNQLLVKVFAVSLNPIDYKRKDGATKMIIADEFPAGICFDVAGTVEKISSPDSVSGFTIGQRICARSKVSGTLADYAIIDEDVAAQLPNNISFVEGAAVPLTGQTALQCLRHGQLQPGQSVFIAGGAGGVGTFMLQLAKHVFKAGKVVTTCSAAKADFCKSLGADECIDYTQGNPYQLKQGEDAFDLVVDTVGDARKMGGPLIKPGRLVVSIAAAPEVGGFDRINFKLPFYMRPLLAVVSIPEKWGASPGIYNYLFLHPNAKDLKEIVGYLGEGKIKACIDSVFDGLDKSQEAFAKLESGRAKGKVIVVVRKV